MTTALVYSNMRQSPALRFVGFSVKPRKPESKKPWDSLLEDKYRGTLYVRHLTVGLQLGECLKFGLRN